MQLTRWHCCRIVPDAQANDSAVWSGRAAECPREKSALDARRHGERRRPCDDPSVGPPGPEAGTAGRREARQVGERARAQERAREKTREQAREQPREHVGGQGAGDEVGVRALRSVQVRICVGVWCCLERVEIWISGDRSDDGSFVEMFDDICALLAPVCPAYVVVMREAQA